MEFIQRLHHYRHKSNLFNCPVNCFKKVGMYLAPAMSLNIQKAHRPIIILEDDMDDQEIMKEVLDDLQIPYRIDFYVQAKDLLDYLYTTKESPFLILSDVNLPSMNGLELRKIINADDYLRLKSVPFVFFSTSADEYAVRQAYELTVQGYFVKRYSIPEIKETLKLIINYWEHCEHVNAKSRV